MKKIYTLLLIILGLFLISGCDEENNEKQIIITPCTFDTAVELHTDLQLSYLANDDYTTVPEGVKGESELSIPKAVIFTWDYELVGFDEVIEPTSYKLYISENEDFSDSLIYTSTVTKIVVYNLKVHTKYYYKVTALYQKLQYSSNTLSFTTSDTNLRNLYIGGVTNVRDLGGYLTSSGKYVKQGLLFRSGRFNKSETHQLVPEITEFGKNQFKNVLKIKTEIDFRHADDLEEGYNESGLMNYETHSLVDESVAYTNIQITYSTTDFYGTDSADLKKVFEMIANENNYPIVYHCDIGTDRTGLVSVAILGLMGVSMEDIYRDYMFSNFANINPNQNKNGNRTISNIQKNIDIIKTYSGSTFQEQVRNMLKDKVGLSDETLDNIYNILIEE